MNLHEYEFPRHVHAPVSRRDWDAGVRRFRVVHDADECEAAFSDGYALLPVIVEAASDAVYMLPVAALVPGALDMSEPAVTVGHDEPVSPIKRKPGRPRKVTP